ncbi:MAG: DUF1328 family protein [Pseudomonadota bacterium]
MLNYIILFFGLAVIAAIMGFGGLAGDFAEIARFFAGLFIIMFIITLIYNVTTGKRLPPPL